MPIEILRNLVNIAICMFFGSLVFARNVKSIKNRIFFLFTITISLWDLLDLMILFSGSYEQAFLLSTFFPLAMSLSAIMLFGLVIVLTDNYKLLKTSYFYIFLVIPMLIFFFKSLLFSRNAIDRINDLWVISYQGEGYLEEIFGVYIYLWLIILVIKYLKKRGVSRKKKLAKFSLVGLMTVFIGNLLMDLLMIFGIRFPMPFIYGLTILSVTIGIGMLRYTKSSN